MDEEGLADLLRPRGQGWCVSSVRLEGLCCHHVSGRLPSPVLSSPAGMSGMSGYPWSERGEALSSRLSPATGEGGGST